MRVAVVTPFHREPVEWLSLAQRSVRAQSHPCDHILIGDAAKVTPPLPGIVVNLPVGVADYGDTPRGVGSMYAAGLGYDAIAYLDGDNAFHRDHIASLVELQRRTGAAVVTSRRAFIRLDGSYMAECTASDGEIFCDTNCLLITRKAFDVLAQWALMDRAFHPIDDRVIWHHILRAGHSRAHTGRATAIYRATYPGFYTDLGEAPPAGVKTPTGNPIGEALAAWVAAGNPPIRPRWGYQRYRRPGA